MSDLDELKELLFGAEKQALDSIAQRVESREVRATDVADVLPEAIYRSHKHGGELVESLTPPVGECVQQALRDDPETYSDALYPIMGPAIRKSIAHALKSLSEQINQAIEHSISPKGIRWRLEASRAGIPFGEYVVLKTLLFRVEQAYLISRENGLLMAHVHHAASKIKDSDAVSAMFTAIQDFVKESFSPDRTGRLESADMGEFTLWAVHGPHALLVCVIRGVPPRSLRGDLTAVLERIHFRYGDAIRAYKGDTSSVPEVEVELQRCLQFEARYEDVDAEESPEKSRRLPIAAIVLLLLLAGLAVYFAMGRWSEMQKADGLAAALADTPGIYAAAVERVGGMITVRGLRDPLAADVNEIAGNLGIPPENLKVSLQPFQSLAPEILVRRSERELGRPESVHFRVEDSTLIVTGEADGAWRQRLQANFDAVDGIDSLDATGLALSGRAELLEAFDNLDGRYFYFDEGVNLASGNEEALNDYGAELEKFAATARELGYELRATVLGSTDNVGGAAVNASLANARANAVAYVLAQKGIDIQETRRAPSPGDDAADNEAGAVAIKQRNAQVLLELVPPAPAA